MPRSSPAPVAWVHLLQALAAREGVEQLGLSSRRVADLLGVAPSAVSQYLSGKRVEKGFLAYASDDHARRIARRTVEALVEADDHGRASPRLVFDGAAELASLAPAGGRRGPAPAAEPGPSAPEMREIARWLRQRVAAEQVAVARCMRLAQHARDELTRALLRQIASDSLRHAEIVTSLATYIDRGVSAAFASGVSRREVEALIEGERAAEEEGATPAVQHLRGTMAILLASMEADERKHTEMLRELLTRGFRP